MAAVGQILLADDEQTFRESTAELLRQQGYECDCVQDAHTAAEKLGNNSYDLLIADVKMPGNSDLELIKHLHKIVGGTPVILVTAFPSQKSAIEAVQLPVAAYMVKPIDFDELKKSVAEAIRRKSLFQTVSDTKHRLEDWQKQMQGIEEGLQEKSLKKVFSASVKNFLDLSLFNISASFQDVKNLTNILTDRNSEPPVCNLLNCPKLTQLLEGLTEAVSGLEKTKSSFKSKELGLLRIKLEQLLKKTKNI